MSPPCGASPLLCTSRWRWRSHDWVSKDEEQIQYVLTLASKASQFCPPPNVEGNLFPLSSNFPNCAGWSKSSFKPWMMISLIPSKYAPKDPFVASQPRPVVSFPGHHNFVIHPVRLETYFWQMKTWTGSERPTQGAATWWLGYSCSTLWLQTWKKGKGIGEEERGEWADDLKGTGKSCSSLFFAILLWFVQSFLHCEEGG